MSLRVEIISDPEEGGFTACIPDIPAYGEGATQDEAIEDLKEALRAFISVVGLDDARSRIRPQGEIRELDVDLTEICRS